MKKAKVVVNQAAQKNRLTFGKRAALSALGIVATLGVITVAVPTSNIPGFSYIAQAIGLNADVTRDLTMADFASYAIGTKDNKIQELRARNLSYNGSGNYGGGLSPFATLNEDRLAEAYAKNAQEALEIEKSLRGKITPFDKNLAARELLFDSDMIAKGFDPSKISGRSKAAHSGAMEALAAAAGQQTEAFGRPLQKGDLQNVANMVGLPDANISNIVGGGNIASISSKNNSLYERMIKAAHALTGTSLFGIANAELNRTDTRIGRPVYGLFKDLGNSYFFSKYAVTAKLPTAASDIAAAAFDGGSPQNQSLITDEDSTVLSGSTNPMLSLNSSAQSVQKCQDVKETYKQQIASYYANLQAIKNTMKELYNEGTKTPGFCYGLNGNRDVKAARNAWNSQLTNIQNYCQNIRKKRLQFAGQCGITFEEPVKSCEDMAQDLRLAAVDTAGVMYKKCRKMSVFDRTGTVKFTGENRRKLRQWPGVYNNYYSSYIQQNYSPEEADQLAILAADEELDFNMDDIEGICRTERECDRYFDDRIEEGFAFRKILSITSLPKK